MMSTLISIELLRKGFSFRIEKCTKIDLVLQAGLIFVAIVCTVLGALIVLKEDKDKRQNGLKYAKGEFRLSSCGKVLYL